MSFPLREQVRILLNTEDIIKKKSNKSKEHFFNHVFKPFLPSMWFSRLHVIFHYWFLEHLTSNSKNWWSLFLFLFSSPLTPPPSLILCSIFACMEGLVFLFSQLSRPGELWLCSTVYFSFLISDILPSRIWRYRRVVLIRVFWHAHVW